MNQTEMDLFIEAVRAEMNPDAYPVGDEQDEQLFDAIAPIIGRMPWIDAAELRAATEKVILVYGLQ